MRTADAHRRHIPLTLGALGTFLVGLEKIKVPIDKKKISGPC